MKKFFERFSVRNNPKEQVDIYSYDNVPDILKNQIVHILNDIIDPHIESVSIWEIIEKRILKEFGLLSLSGYGPDGRVINFFLKSNFEEALDTIDITFHFLHQLSKNTRSYNREDEKFLKRLEIGIEELNFRFKQQNLGYEILEGQLIKIDNQFAHKEIVKPAINLLYQEGFTTASDEFLKAHEHYRNQQFEEAIVDAERAFESTMKIICHKKKYEYKESMSAKKLIDVLLANEFIPQYSQNHFKQLCNTLENGLPTVRNKNGSHGQGVNTVKIPDYIASYAINLCATNIIFLVKIYSSK